MWNKITVLIALSIYYLYSKNIIKLFQARSIKIQSDKCLLKIEMLGFRVADIIFYLGFFYGLPLAYISLTLQNCMQSL